MSTESPVVIIGAGMAGLTCAVYLKQAGINALLLEASDDVGGRVRTDEVDGFRLDRGFQILLTAYPETQRLLNYTALDLRAFRSGALIRYEGDRASHWATLLNPFQEPQSVFQTLVSPVGTFADKLRIVELLQRTKRLTVSDLFRQTPTTTLAYLREMGFSERMIQLFFRPFFGGVFLEDALVTSSNFFEFCFRMFYSGDVAVPALGIGEIPRQLANRLTPDQIRLNCPVSHIEGHQIRLATGDTITAKTIVLAVDAAQIAQLLNRTVPPEQAFNHTTCTYFTAPASPNQQKLLMLNPNRASAVHNIAVMTDVAPGYAANGRSLISVSTQGLETVREDVLAERIRTELTGWFGETVKSWQHLKTYHIPHALPAYNAGSALTDVHATLKLDAHLYQCGDRTAYPSLNAAMQTGREVAEMISENQSV
ncbi:FAD-dependent oxidoreductase [Fibrisoma montanum]|uniref:FAD-dependent oxidoreductase n=1 Tax=Fibrisoma montanum TaxID=2305895 RepID=A0A418MFB9_9BACT|nr:NAD(P)/FAD-dependent oxidoreductase [Fibrisoma montanum]RIV25494.1 FAD-dependent oxidoreductase [Fibrisoma montanum]